MTYNRFYGPNLTQDQDHALAEYGIIGLQSSGWALRRSWVLVEGFQIRGFKELVDACSHQMVDVYG